MSLPLATRIKANSISVMGWGCIAIAFSVLPTQLWAQSPPLEITHYQDLHPLRAEGAEALWSSPVARRVSAPYSITVLGDRLTDEKPRGVIAGLGRFGNYSQIGVSYGTDADAHLYSGLVSVNPLKGLEWGISYQALWLEDELTAKYQMAWAYQFYKSLNQQLLFVLNEEEEVIVKTGLEYRWLSSSSFFIDLNPEVGYHFEGIDRMPLALGLGLGIGENTPLEIRARVAKSEGPESNFSELSSYGWSAGLQLMRWQGPYQVKLNYIFSGLNFEGKGSGLHGVGLSFFFGSNLDPVAPMVILRVVQPSKKVNELRSAPFTFVIDAKDNSGKIQQWVLVVAKVNSEGAAQGILFSHRGEGKPNRFFDWNGVLSSGEKVGAGLYGARLLITDTQGNASATEWQYLEVR